MIERRNNYKLKKREKEMRIRGVKAQVAIFVIIAIVIIAVVLAIFLYPRLKVGVTSEEFSPTSYLKSCIEQDFRSTVDILGKQAGYQNPDGFIVYQGQKIKYLCYTSDFYKTCVVQQPMIQSHFEQELDSIVSTKAKTCIDNLKAEYGKQGYSVLNTRSDLSVSIIPHKILVNFIAPMTVSKGDQAKTFKEFDVEISSEMFDLVSIASSIVEYESTYGDSETTLYTQYYPDLRIEKTKLSDGSKIYILTDVVTKEQFTFASRSLAWPPGYGITQ